MPSQNNQFVRNTKLVSILGLVSVLTLSAKDFWEEKAFNQWDEKQALRILSDSPWAKTQLVLGGGESTGRALDTPRVLTPGGGNTAGAAASSGTPTFGAGSVPLYVRWYSSQRIRQALGRLGQLQSNASDEQVNQFIREPMQDYLIAVVGPAMKPFEDANLESLKGKTFLLSKKDKNKKIELKSYISPKERKDGMALFGFPRLVNEKPSLGLADEEAQFVSQVGQVRVNVSFKLAKMMTDSSLDL
ncbi:MAG: hypothetical protein DMG06_23430 [Acidobacteria bacterium]|nr:MAG: hypothetical protein DMG06_23430 [Acidobacteriota bacterium]